MPHAQCPMPNAQCPMPNAPCPINNKKPTVFDKDCRQILCSLLMTRLEFSYKEVLQLDLG
ncbi:MULTISPECIES: hypothetical protein [Calothrix]|uniref:Uncharacterized protein n=2 Tax=Calothrix TaxID=1186 RepID=A0ABR8AAT9_9CYAN|nr:MULTISPECIES: hypothetical protein [Calothrix]MBD2197072.1 hypothetical protein [Calothrix parietina FACHB-288]MBD2225707.1 hypothetical protein [Calothrix anomala FACHB-343]